MHDERIEKLEIYVHGVQGDSSIILSRGICMWKVCENIASIVGIFIFSRHCTIFTFFIMKPQLACHWSVGKVFSSNRMLRTRGNREFLSRNGLHFVARLVRLRCYFWHYFRLFQVFLIPPSWIMQFLTFDLSFSDRFPYYKSNDDRWKNSVRHNLSINPHFRKGNKAKAGAGHLWKISSRESEANFLAWEHVSIFGIYFNIFEKSSEISNQ